MTLDLIVIKFEKDRMTLRVPVDKAANSGLRKLSSRKMMDTALTTLKGRSRAKRTMWSRRAQEYEAKINSGDPVSIAEVVRDLHRSADQPDQSYSERQMYQAALDRLARELAAVEKIDEDAAAIEAGKAAGRLGGQDSECIAQPPACSLRESRAVGDSAPAFPPLHSKLSPTNPANREILRFEHSRKAT